MTGRIAVSAGASEPKTFVERAMQMDFGAYEITDDRIMHLSRAVLNQQTIELLTNAQDANWPVYGACFPTGALMVATEFAIRPFAPSDLRNVIDFALSQGCSYIVLYPSDNDKN